jgi:nicotinamide-nucleotide amidase
MTMHEELIGQIVARLHGRNIACAESCTGGQVSVALAAAGGASAWFRGAVVAYQVPVKRALLGVHAPTVVGEPAAQEMAAGVARLLEAEVAVSTTGVAGDEPQEGQPPGTAIIATSVDGWTQSRTYHFDGDAAAVCAQVVRRALEDLLAALASPPPTAPPQ